MTLNGRRIARSVMWGSAGVNVAVTLVDLARREYTVAAIQSVFVVALAVWLYVMPRVDAWLDARMAEARAHQHTAEVIHGEVQRLVATGELHIEECGPLRSTRMH